MKSQLYTGTVRHRRTPPRDYQFSYGVFYFSLDLDEIDEVERRIKLFSYSGFNLLSFRDGDHMSTPGVSLRTSMRAHLTSIGVDIEGASVALLTNVRILNYVFNPVSFFLVRDAGGTLRHVIAEVHNTHGERHAYDLKRTSPVGDEWYVAGAMKEFYVSPFIDMEARYEFRVADAGGRLRIGIDEFRGDERFFQAELDLAERPLTDANVARALVRYPFVTLKTIALIHWHGLRLWLRGERYRKHTPQGEAPP